MRKSVSAFVFGLIGGIFCVMWGFIFGVLGDGLSSCDIIKESDANSTITAFQILGWIAFLGGIGAIIGASQCFKDARRGAIITSACTVPASALLVYVFIKATSGTVMIPTLILIFLLPVIFLIVADVCAFLAKDQPNNVNATFGGQAQVSHPAAPVAQSNSKTLEQELTKLKEMRDKNLLTEEEYNQARQKAINNYNK